MMRGIAAFMVAYFHIARGNKSFLDHSNFFFRIGELGWAGVEIFFIISGFIIVYAMFKGGYTIARIHRFMAKRLMRLEPPYIISIVLVLILMYISTLSPYYRGKPLNIDWMNVLGHLGYVNAFTGQPWLQDIYWTLAIEFEFYIGLSLLYPFLMHSQKITQWATMAAILAMSFIPTGIGHVFQYLPLFCMGIFLSMFKLGQLNKIEFGTFFLAAILLCYHNQGAIILGLALFSIAVIWFLKYVPKPLSWLGKISYSLYLLHIPIGGRIINISQVLIKDQNMRVVMVFVALIICLICSHIFYKLVEKPSQRLSKKISY